MRTDRERLQDILEAIGGIEKYASKGRDQFQKDELLQTWVIHHLEIIGEASRALSMEFRKNHPELPWAGIVGMRNILAHDYFGIDLVEVWKVIEHDLPSIKPRLQALLRVLPSK